MSGPSSLQAAEREMASLVGGALGGSVTTKREHLRRAMELASWLYRQHRVGIRTANMNQVRGFLDSIHATRGGNVAYHHWLIIQRILEQLGKEESWAPYMRGPWCRNGSGGRPRK